MKLYRIGSTGASWLPDDLSGSGAAASPGRWNTSGTPVLYVAPTIALAMLETSAHVRVPHLPLNRYLVEIDVPDDVWARRRETSESDLPVGWDAIPHGVISTAFGDAWLLACGEAVHLVPSSIVPEEPIVLINPRHSDAARITAKAVRKIQFAALFR